MFKLFYLFSLEVKKCFVFLVSFNMKVLSKQGFLSLLHPVRMKQLCCWLLLVSKSFWSSTPVFNLELNPLSCHKPNAHRWQETRNRKHVSCFLTLTSVCVGRKQNNEQLFSWTLVSWYKRLFCKQVYCFCPMHTGVRKRKTYFLFRVVQFLFSLCVWL